jgi:NADPH-dependent 2,4-dienoyl-CoA reductase/sulfur reductase-like enzyme
MGKVDLRRHRLHSTSGEVIGFEQLLIATGSTVRRLHVPGADGPRIFYLRTEGFTAHHAQIKRGQRAVVIGSGFIGRVIDWEVHRRRALRARCYGFGDGMVFRFWSPCPGVWLPSWS